MELDEKDKADITETIRVLVELHEEKWNGIWCSIIADRFAAGSIPQMSHIAGNPPWVKWSHLPAPYAEFIKPQCLEINVFSEDRYVGGIESDISTVITFQAIRKWLAPNGRLAFFINCDRFLERIQPGIPTIRFSRRQSDVSSCGSGRFQKYPSLQRGNKSPCLAHRQGRERHILSRPLSHLVWAINPSRVCQ